MSTRQDSTLRLYSIFLVDSLLVLYFSSSYSIFTYRERNCSRSVFLYINTHRAIPNIVYNACQNKKFPKHICFLAKSKEFKRWLRKWKDNRRQNKKYNWIRQRVGTSFSEAVYGNEWVCGRKYEGFMLKNKKWRIEIENRHMQ